MRSAVANFDKFQLHFFEKILSFDFSEVGPAHSHTMPDLQASTERSALQFAELEKAHAA